MLEEKYAKWKGVAREMINWYPTIESEKCTGCGMCVTSCGRDVYDYDSQKGKAIVARPLQCMVGCKSCETWCVFDAITFPGTDYVKNLINERKILILAKKQLKEKMLPQ